MMRDGLSQTELERAIALLGQARHAIALTGAGISTPSGIPDFRTPGKGLWEEIDAMEVASFQAFRSDPGAFYRWIRPHLDLIVNAQPNAAHRALAQLEDAGRLKAVLTQNIDGLHQQAGSRSVVELHGHLRSASCLDCTTTWPAETVLAALASEELPRCPSCAGVLKPDAILFGEQLPADAMSNALIHARQADLILVIGSSLTVIPAAHLPMVVRDNGGATMVFNHQPTCADDFAAAVFRQDVAEILPRLAQGCLDDLP